MVQYLKVPQMLQSLFKEENNLITAKQNIIEENGAR